jgi:hypothetical protein
MDTERLYKWPCRADSVSRRHEAVMERSCENSSRRVISQPQDLTNYPTTVEGKTLIVQVEPERALGNHRL